MVPAIFGFPASARPSGTEMLRISENDVAIARRLSFSFGAAFRAQLARTKRSEELIVPGRKEAVDIFPIGRDRQLLIESRRVRHHRIFRAMVDNELAVQIFEDRAIAGGVR